MTNNNHKLLNLLSNVLDVAPGSISDTTSPENTDAWDSYNALVLVSELESEFNISFEMDEVYAVKCVGDIKQALERHGINLSE
jgi:acyl carrier protein